MKKFYESPIVELTVFDVEDVITASGEIEVNTLEADVEALKATINGSTYANANEVKATTYGSYNW